MPPTLKLVYIEGLAARAFPTRFALRCAGLSFVDQRISREELQAMAAQFQGGGGGPPGGPGGREGGRREGGDGERVRRPPVEE